MIQSRCLFQMENILSISYRFATSFTRSPISDHQTK